MQIKNVVGQVLAGCISHNIQRKLDAMQKDTCIHEFDEMDWYEGYEGYLKMVYRKSTNQLWVKYGSRYTSPWEMPLPQRNIHDAIQYVQTMIHHAPYVGDSFPLAPHNLPLKSYWTLHVADDDGCTFYFKLDHLWQPDLNIIIFSHERVLDHGYLKEILGNSCLHDYPHKRCMGYIREYQTAYADEYGYVDITLKGIVDFPKPVRMKKDYADGLVPKQIYFFTVHHETEKSIWVMPIPVDTILDYYNLSDVL